MLIFKDYLGADYLNTWEVSWRFLSPWDQQVEALATTPKQIPCMLIWWCLHLKLQLTILSEEFCSYLVPSCVGGCETSWICRIWSNFTHRRQLRHLSTMNQSKKGHALVNRIHTVEMESYIYVLHFRCPSLDQDGALLVNSFGHGYKSALWVNYS